MRIIFSPYNKYATWRHLWTTLAKGEKMLGLNISDTQIEELEKHIWDIPFDRAAEIEQETRHDVMAHIKAYAEQCPEAAPIIHLGATSAFVADNADVVILDEALAAIMEQIYALRDSLMRLAKKHKNTPTLAYTHFQSAQPTTFGKRVCMWLQDLDDDYNRLKRERNNLKILGCKGATGTCASFMELFDGDYDKVKELDEFVANSVNIPSFTVSGQTYSRKQDYYVFSVLSGVAQTLSKIANDLRLMSGKGEFYEPFGEKQVGSSAMAYKQNPLRCEKVTSLARLVINNATAIANTAANQWLERSLDDSAIRRVVIPETFLMLDEIITTMTDVIERGQVQEEVMFANLSKEMSKIASEGILMAAVKKGGDRQGLHEIIRQYTTSDPMHFLNKVCADKRFNLTRNEVLELIAVSKLIGAAPMQVEDYERKRQ
jgi:adenylosuccinate lyase